VLARDTIVPAVRALFAAMSRADLMARLETLGLPFAPITRPAELFDDPHLNAAGGLVGVTIADGTATRLPALPLEMDGVRPGLLRDIPGIGADADAVLAEIGRTTTDVAGLRARAVVA
jgi:crotonobetainyl-CoA:carnitine CoA-transferase CaiB-like acyl-CoA transferase